MQHACNQVVSEGFVIRRASSFRSRSRKWLLIQAPRIKDELTFKRVTEDAHAGIRAGTAQIQYAGELDGLPVLQVTLQGASDQRTMLMSVEQPHELDESDYPWQTGRSWRPKWRSPIRRSFTEVFGKCDAILLALDGQVYSVNSVKAGREYWSGPRYPNAGQVVESKPTTPMESDLHDEESKVTEMSPVEPMETRMSTESTIISGERVPTAADGHFD